MIEIRFEGVGQVFDGRQVLGNLTCVVRGGQITAVAGANGSGKFDASASRGTAHAPDVRDGDNAP